MTLSPFLFFFLNTVASRGLTYWHEGFQKCHGDIHKHEWRGVDECARSCVGDGKCVRFTEGWGHCWHYGADSSCSKDPDNYWVRREVPRIRPILTVNNDHEMSLSLEGTMMEHVIRNRLVLSGHMGSEIFDEHKGGFGVRCWLDDVDLSFPRNNRFYAKAKVSCETYGKGWKKSFNGHVDAEFDVSISNDQLQVSVDRGSIGTWWNNDLIRTIANWMAGFAKDKISDLLSQQIETFLNPYKDIKKLIRDAAVPFIASQVGVSQGAATNLVNSLQNQFSFSIAMHDNTLYFIVKCQSALPISKGSVQPFHLEL